MHFRRKSALALAVAALAGLAPSMARCAALGQEETHAESLRADAAHPRIFLGARRLRLLRRERERQSLRWNQFHLLMAGKAPMPEPGFAQALYYQVSGSAEAGQQAVAWALGAGADLRQLALVFDWCQDVLTEAQSKTLAAKLARGIQQSRRDSSVSAVRSRLLAAVALSGHLPGVPEREIDQVVRNWWEGEVVPVIVGGHEAFSRDDTYALMEILHVVRDNFNQDLREAAPGFFTDLPMVHLLSHYPATFPAGENDYRIPAAPHGGTAGGSSGQPDLRRAALSRAAELSMVAYDSNAPGSQILQGWLMNDHFLLRGTFGAPYEFLWANPYQPGLSYFQAPLVVHDSLFGCSVRAVELGRIRRMAGILRGRAADVQQRRRRRARSARHGGAFGPGAGRDFVRRAHAEIQGRRGGQRTGVRGGTEAAAELCDRSGRRRTLRATDRPGRHPGAGRAAR